MMENRCGRRWWLITRITLLASCAYACGDAAGDTGMGVPQANAGAGGAAANASGSGAGAPGLAGASAGASVIMAGNGGAGGGTAGTAGAAGTAGTAGTAGIDPVDMMDAMTMEPELPFGGVGDVFTWSTGEFTLEAGQEQYLCFASSLAEDLIVNGYNKQGGQPYVHHLIFSRARQPEPDGFAECDVAFKTGWEPVFITGAGATTLEFPDDAGHDLRSGTQLVVQMHLLNASEEAVTGSLDIHMRRSSIANPRPVSSYIFGTAAVELPAMTTTEVVGTCPMWQPVQLIAGFPHMHKLGTTMTFEVGTSETTMREVFKRDPFDFDDQRIEPLELSIAAGDVTRVRCTYDNTHDQTVGYGESTLNEMCYFIGFAIDRPSQSACLEVLPPSIF